MADPWEGHDFDTEPSYLPFVDGSEAKWVPQWGIWIVNCGASEKCMASYLVGLLNHIEDLGGKKAIYEAAQRRMRAIEDNLP